ncbi:MAG: hypothetical protein JWQ32_1431 [Marmoricola sp.]|nr:hypothetical protein [Marmoricola sp.]
MSEILSILAVVMILLAGLAVLVRWVRRDTFSSAPRRSRAAN